MGGGTVYRGSNGRYYGDVDVWERLEAETWVPCFWDVTSGNEWMKTQGQELLALIPIARSEVPDEVDTECVAAGLTTDPRE
jgi:hypothetical protein